MKRFIALLFVALVFSVVLPTAQSTREGLIAADDGVVWYPSWDLEFSWPREEGDGQGIYRINETTYYALGADVGETEAYCGDEYTLIMANYSSVNKTYVFVSAWNKTAYVYVANSTNPYWLYGHVEPVAVVKNNATLLELDAQYIRVLQYIGDGEYVPESWNITVRVWRFYPLGAVPPVPGPGPGPGPGTGEPITMAGQEDINKTATAIVVFTLLGVIGLIILRKPRRRRQ